MKTLDYKLSVKIVFQNRNNSVTLDLIPSNVVFVPAVFTLLESQEGDTINISRGDTVRPRPEQQPSRKTLLCRLCDLAKLEALSEEKCSVIRPPNNN